MDKDGDFFDCVKMNEDTVPLMQMFAVMPWLLGVLQPLPRKNNDAY
jgi:hypothetical protein